MGFPQAQFYMALPNGHAKVQFFQPIIYIFQGLNLFAAPYFRKYLLQWNLIYLDEAVIVYCAVWECILFANWAIGIAISFCSGAVRALQTLCFQQKSGIFL